MDYHYLAQSLAALAGVPVRIYLDGKFRNLYHHTKFKPDFAITEEPNIFRQPGNVSYYMDENFLYYGLLRTAKDGVALVMGPVTQAAVNRPLAVKILRSMGENVSRAGELMDYFSAIPSYPLRNFLQILCTVNFFLNDEKLDVSRILLSEETTHPDAGETKMRSDEEEAKMRSDEGERPDSSAISRGAAPLPGKNRPLPHPRPAPPKPESRPTAHNTDELEALMLSCVEYGRLDEIRKLFQRPVTGRAGAMAADALRQEKNLIICTATLVTRAAIRGGLDKATAFSLSDSYIQRAELMEDYQGLVRLNARMLEDFTGRVAEARSGGGSSPLLRRVREYILLHLDKAVTTEALSRAAGMNRTYLCKRFQEEAGMTLNRYVTAVKMDEARRLLEITKKTPAEIAEVLGYSSQSYFQSVFKKHTGRTPGQYRAASGYGRPPGPLQCE